MHILIANTGKIPVTKYGGTERVIWYLGKELSKIGHQISFLVEENSTCDFAEVLYLDKTKSLNQQIPRHIDFVHFNFQLKEKIDKPYLVTMHGNPHPSEILDKNTVFVSKNHAARNHSTQYVYNGLDWDDYGIPDLNNQRNYFHFLGNASWRLKNVKGAIQIINKTKDEHLKVLGGNRLNFRMGFRFTMSNRVSFCGMVGGKEKNELLQGSKGLIFPVLWDEPFGLAIIESLYFGCPVFGTPRGSLPEIVNDKIGFLSADFNALSDALERSNQYSREACHEYAISKFNSKIMATSYLEKYKLILSQNNLTTE
ncbi:MAG: glycosyltransferase [Saprospiraceae bacterium]